ncbi:Cu,Zn superoxide dismutase-like protein [Suhomyces tanzawaensis NRRL Y-17324]|uniref:Cu,Zn superoxide dismutase-like protein n=1 Tax=Suhomyces tanzawaensis NRRL Y-17324 TaxID=984487 RepID=A0A1E4SLU7_9ASCO|nr:Cu,Zn superoxide dismutase-like protein [Suhomyces tanzawaensis NRRL Y-17324]ODV80458.1 Cu,Zn superoxide dismutase-like protein [Suhomyces tanzawaensis NRRL Y-17324]
MVSFKKLAAASVIPTLALAEDAPVVSNSPVDIKYLATFHGNNTNNVQGQVEFVGATNGSTWVNVHFEGLPAAGGPFPYHIHQHQVPADGDCYAALGHLNPYNGSATAETNAGKEVGDLSGKHGPINGTTLHVSYIDRYVSLNSSDPAFAGNLSIVVHYADNTRLACANIVREYTANNTRPSGSNSSSNAAGSNAANGVFIGAFVAGLSLLI